MERKLRVFCLGFGGLVGMFVGAVLGACAVLAPLRLAAESAWVACAGKTEGKQEACIVGWYGKRGMRVDSIRLGRVEAKRRDASAVRTAGGIVR